jgi:Peptidase family S41
MQCLDTQHQGIRPVGYGMIGRRCLDVLGLNETRGPGITPFPTGRIVLAPFPGIACLATIIQSLRDKIGLSAKCGYCFLQSKEMKYAVAVSVLLAGLTSATLAVETPSPTPAASPASSAQSGSSRLIDQLDLNQLKELLDNLRTNYVDSRALTNDELNQTAIKLLLAKLGPGVRVQTQSEFARAIPVRPFRFDVVSNRFSYIRLGTLKDNTLTQLDNALAESRSRNVEGLIIDLRTVSEDSDYDLANSIISRFVGNGEPTFELITKGTAEPTKFTSKSTPLYQGPIAVLIDRETAGAAEVIAGVLKTKDRALLIGQPTAGRAVKYKTEPLGNLQVSVAESEVQIAGLPLIFPGGLVPDIPVNEAQDVENQVLAQSDSGPLDPFITDEERPRLNEAALVNGTNPELDAYEEQEAGKISKGQLKDESLQHAIDFLITLSLYKK